MIHVAILTMSDEGSRGGRVDESGRLICEMIKDISGRVGAHEIIPDEQKIIEEKLRHFADTVGVDLIITAGGTGISPRDVMPEATRNVLERGNPGFRGSIGGGGGRGAKEKELSPPSGGCGRGPL